MVRYDADLRLKQCAHTCVVTRLARTLRNRGKGIEAAELDEAVDDLLSAFLDRGGPPPDRERIPRKDGRPMVVLSMEFPDSAGASRKKPKPPAAGRIQE